MRVLFLAPQPFYQERGTPIAIRLALETLAERVRECGESDSEIQVLTYHEGEDIDIPGVKITRIRAPRFLSNIPPGISCKKLLCDLLLAILTFKTLWRARTKRFDLVHAVEESVFIAFFAKIFFSVPYVYDMDSSLSLQLTDKWWILKPLLPIFRFIERLVVKKSVAVAPVCEELHHIVIKHGAERSVIIRDVSLFDAPFENATTLRSELKLTDQTPLLLYVGNLEGYQGVDLLIEAFSELKARETPGHLVIIGGTPPQIDQLRQKACSLKIEDYCSFLGARPIALLSQYLSSADILVSPRILGNNTPMKIYSYLHSGKAIVATKLPTHTQVLDDEVALLVEPNSKALAEGLRIVISDLSRRLALGEAARIRAEERFTLKAFRSQLTSLYDAVENEIHTVAALKANEA